MAKVVRTPVTNSTVKDNPQPMKGCGFFSLSLESRKLICEALIDWLECSKDDLQESDLDYVY